MSLSIEKLLFGNTTRIRHVIRFGNCHRMRDESVAEHSFFTAFYSMMLGRALKLEEGKLGLLIQRALIHDLEEAESGDFPRPFKYSSPELKNALDLAGESAMAQVLQGTVGEKEKGQLYLLWRDAKSGKLGKVLEFADFLSVLAYVCQEVRASNTTMRRHCLDMAQYFKRFEGAGYDFLQPWIDQAGAILERELR